MENKRPDYWGYCDTHGRWGMSEKGMSELFTPEQRRASKQDDCPICILAARPGLEARP